MGRVEEKGLERERQKGREREKGERERHRERERERKRERKREREREAGGADRERIVGREILPMFMSPCLHAICILFWS